MKKLTSMIAGMLLAFLSFAAAPAEWCEDNLVRKEDSISAYLRVRDAVTGTFVEASGSKLAAFSASGELRGFAEIEGETVGAKLFQLSIFVSSSTENGLTLKVWDAATDLVKAVPETVSAKFGDAQASISVTDAERKAIGKYSAPVVVDLAPIKTAVTFDANGGSGAGASVTATTGAAMPTTTKVPTKTGYTFAGYFDQREGGTQYYDATLKSVHDWDKTDDKVTLFAHWNENPTYGSGKVSEFELSDAMGGGTARIVGVANLTADNFALTLYKGNTWAMNGKTPTEDHYYLCFTGDAGLVDVEKDAIFNNKDDFWCSEFTDLNLAYYGGWIPASKYATVDKAAKALRDTYKAEDFDITFRWLNGKLATFGLAEKGDVNDYVVPFGGNFFEEEFHEFLAEQFDNARRWVCLNADGHAVTCCGYSVGEDDRLNGLFIIDSDNDMFNGGGAEKAPNRIMFCPLSEDTDGWLMIANIFAEEWIWLMGAHALKWVGEPKEPKVIFDAAGGWVSPSEKAIRRGEPFGELPVPERTGYSFVEWRNESYGTVTADTIVRADDAVTLHAIWNAHTYDVRFDANGGEGVMEDMEGLVYDTQTKLPPCSFSSSDPTLTFRGWARTPDGKVAFRDGDLVSNLADVDGAVITLFAVWANAPSGFAFEATETWAEKDGAFALTVYGGSDEAEASVKVTATYGSAKATDLVLKEATVEGESGVEQRNLKFPLTLTWAQGDMAPKTITIPTAKGKSTDAPKSLVWNLSAVKGLEVAEDAYCVGTIEPGADWTGTDVYVLPYVADSTGGKVSGGASVKPDTKGKFKTVTLKATANKGYWFAGWYDADGNWMSGDLSYKVTPDGSDSLPKYEARFVPEQPSLCGTYNGYAKVNLKGMTLVKNADTSADVLGEYAFAVTLAKTGKASGSVTVGGKKITLKGDAVYDAGEGCATYLVTADEKVCFGKANVETLMLEFNSEGMAGLGGHDEAGDAFEPLGGDGCWGTAWKDVSRDQDERKKLEVFAGTYAGAAVQADGCVIPVSIVVDKTGKVKLAGKYSDGTALTASGAMGGHMAFDDGTEAVELELVMNPKALGSGAYHLSVFARTDDAGVPSLLLNGYTTTYTEKAVWAVADAYSQMAYLFTPGCWVPGDADPDFGVVRLYSGEDVIDILYTSQNGAVNGLGKATATGYAVKFDKKTGIFTVTKGKEYTIQGVLGDYGYGCRAVGRINKDGTCESVGLEFTTLPEPQENFPWMADGFVLTLGQNFNEAMQPSVRTDVAPVELTISGLPAGLKYDKKTGRITGAPTKSGPFTVKVSYAYGTQKITRMTTLVVSPKPEGLPTGTYAGYATVHRYYYYHYNTPLGYQSHEEAKVDCPFTATINKNGALTGSIMLFGEKVSFKAGGYDWYSDGDSEYTVMLDLKSIDKTWGTAEVKLGVHEEGDMSVWTDKSFGDGDDEGGHVSYELSGGYVYRNQSSDEGYVDRIAPYVGNYVMSYDTIVSGDGVSLGGVTTLSVAVDKKGVVKLVGTFVDATPFSASTQLVMLKDSFGGFYPVISFAVLPKALAQGSLSFRLELCEALVGDTGMSEFYFRGDMNAVRYVQVSGEFSDMSSYWPDISYRYTSLGWVDPTVSPSDACLSVSCDNGSFEETTFAWKTKKTTDGSVIVGVDKKLSGPAMTFKLDDKTGLFSGTCGTYKIFGAMQEGTCSGVGTVVGRDGSVGRVTVGVVDR